MPSYLSLTRAPRVRARDAAHRTAQGAESRQLAVVEPDGEHVGALLHERPSLGTLPLVAWPVPRTLRVVTKAELIAGNRYMVLSTADASGRPWASPVWYAPDGDEGFLWISRPDARHSLNIAERSQIALVIFDPSRSPAERQALYVEAVAKEVGPDPELVATYSDHSTSQGLGELTVAEVSPPGGEFRLYRAAASEMWILEDDRDQRIPAV